jgi:hypothetical protein
VCRKKAESARQLFLFAERGLSMRSANSFSDLNVPSRGGIVQVCKRVRGSYTPQAGAVTQAKVGLRVEAVEKPCVLIRFPISTVSSLLRSG